jgi:hypothetical protein
VEGGGAVPALVVRAGRAVDVASSSIIISVASTAVTLPSIEI